MLQYFTSLAWTSKSVWNYPLPRYILDWPLLYQQQCFQNLLRRILPQLYLGIYSSASSRHRETGNCGWRAVYSHILVCIPLWHHHCLQPLSGNVFALFRQKVQMLELDLLVLWPDKQANIYGRISMRTWRSLHRNHIHPINCMHCFFVTQSYIKCSGFFPSDPSSSITSECQFVVTGTYVQNWVRQHHCRPKFGGRSSFYHSNYKEQLYGHIITTKVSSHSSRVVHNAHLFECWQ